MPEQDYKDQLDNSRRQNSDREEPSAVLGDSSNETNFPWGMFFVALMFDIVGIIPIINLFTEILASGIIWLWQKQYAPDADFLVSFLGNKIADFVTLGIFPSNIGMVVIAYLQKRAKGAKPAEEGAGTTASPEPSPA